MKSTVWKWQLAVLICVIEPLAAQDIDPNAFFESKIRPLLAANCYDCHTSAASGGLRLDSREAILKGGKSGPAVVPGRPEDSRLILATSYTLDKLRMPPTGKLDDRDLADLVKWIKEGAVWPDTGPVHTGYVITPQQRAFWSFQPLGNPSPPTVDTDRWKRNPVDAFIYEKLGAKGLAPAPAASKRTLIRRATFDLTGLPPSPEEVDAFLSDNSPEAYAKVVDRLLDSPHYGERWGRHWLDLVRYADTAGDSSDYPVPQAYLYRDYVIASFNKNKPYDTFIREQVAGDLMPATNDDQRWERIVATSYLGIARRFGGEPNANMHLTIDDVIDNIGRTVLGLSIACARCHDHKYDPIPTRDYYALYGIFESTRFPYPGSEKQHQPKNLVPRIPQAEADAILKPYRDVMDPIFKRLDKVEGEKRAFVAGPDQKRTMEEILAEIKDLRSRRDALLDKTPKLDLAFAVAEASPRNAHIHVRGEPKDLGDEVPRGFLQILGGQQVQNSKTSGRLELAQWLTDPSNPMTARVMMNRIWQYHFGRGLVASPSDFGKRSQPPSHPELLDYLARRFIDSGWSVKAMQRLIVLSETYRLASDINPKNAEADPDNQFLSRFNRQRLDAESIRDSLLLLSSQLQEGAGGPHPFPHVDTWDFMQHGPFAAVYSSNRRSVYLMTQRIQRHPYLSLFDGADPSLSTPLRSSTTTPLQALFWMNSEFVHEAADSWARRLIESTPDERRRIDQAFQMAYGRPANAGELLRAHQFLAEARKTLATTAIPPAELDRKALASYLRPLIASNEFLFVD